MDTAIAQAGRPAFLTIKQAAWILGVSTDRIHRAIRTGTLPAVRRHCRYEVPAAALKHLLSQVNGHTRCIGGAP